MFLRTLSVTALLIGMALPTSANTFYYISKIELANPWLTAGTPASTQRVVTGALHFDASKAPGNTLANLEVRYQPDDTTTGSDETERVNTDALTSWEFDCPVPCINEAGGTDTYYTARFNEEGILSHLDFGSYADQADFLGIGWRIHSGGVLVQDEISQTLDPNFTANTVLDQLGYTSPHGAEDYAALFCGSWAPSPYNSCTNDEDQSFAALAWNYNIASTSAFLFADFISFSQEMQRILADTTPLPGWNSIPPAPAPIPAPLMLMFAGISIFAGMRLLRK